MPTRVGQLLRSFTLSHHSYEIKTFDPRAASDADFEALTVLENTLQAESQPDDPSTSVEELKLRLLNIPPIFGFAQWVATDGQEMVAHANIGIPRMDTNKHLVQFDIGVLPEWRRHGLGTRLLSEIADVAEHEERSLLVSGTRTTAPSGDGFMEALGGNVGLATHVNDLNVADLNHALLQEWLKRAPDRAAGFEMLEWEGKVSRRSDGCGCRPAGIHKSHADRRFTARGLSLDRRANSAAGRRNLRAGKGTVDVCG